MRVIVVEPPAPVVSWEEADRHLRLDGDPEQQAAVEAFVAAATAHIDGPEGWLGRALGPQTLELRLDRDACGAAITLPLPPVTELVSVTYLDAQEVEQTAELADIQHVGSDLVSAVCQLPWAGGSSRREAVRIRYRAGYETLPPPIRAAILLMVGDLYRHRGTTETGMSVQKVEMSVAPVALLQPYRIYS